MIMPLLPQNSKLVSELADFDYVIGYAIDTSGNVWSCKRTKYHTLTYWKLLKKRFDTKGYSNMAIFKGSKRKYYRVHRLMAMLFIPNPDNKSEINHKNGNRQDNRIENLEWVTRNENIQHAYDILCRHRLRGTNSPQAKLNDESVREIKRLLADGNSQRSTAKKFGVCHSIIRGIHNGTRWAHVKT